MAECNDCCFIEAVMTTKVGRSAEIANTMLPRCFRFQTTLASHSVRRFPTLLFNRSTLHQSAPSSNQSNTISTETPKADATMEGSTQFNTFEFVKRLEEAGLSAEQSAAVLGCLVEVVEESIQSINQSLIPRTEQDRTIRAYQSNFIHLKSEISLLEKNDFAIIKQENERIASEVEKLKSKMRDDLQRLQAGVRLDMNLDKARVRDEQNALLSKIKQTESKLETEIGQMRAAIENVRWDTIKTIGAAGTSIGLVVLAWARYFKM